MRSDDHESGAALVVSLVLLVVASLLGLSSMQSSRLEESMAGNSRAMVTARMAAEYAISRHWEDVVDSGGEDECGSGPDYNYVTFFPAAGDWERVNAQQLDQDVVYRIEYCKGDGIGFYRLKAHGAVLSGSDVLTRNIIDATAIKYGSGFLGFSPITISSPLNNFTPADSNAFDVEGEELIDGSRNPAITTSNSDDETAIVNALSEDRLDNYLGGISSPLSESLLEDVAKFDEFITLLQGEADAYYEGDVSNPSAGSSDNPQITFIDGNFNQGQGNFSGAGVMVVRGDADLNGTPSFEGLLIVLGDYTVSGGGRGVFNGSLLVSPYAANEDGVLESQQANLDFSGGGNATYLYDAAAMDTAFGLLGGAGEYWTDNNVSGRKPGVLEIDSWAERVDF